MFVRVRVCVFKGVTGSDIHCNTKDVNLCRYIVSFVRVDGSCIINIIIVVVVKYKLSAYDVFVSGETIQRILKAYLDARKHERYDFELGWG